MKLDKEIQEKESMVKGYIELHEKEGEPFSDAIIPMLKGLLMSDEKPTPFGWRTSENLILLFKDWIECYTNRKYGLISGKSEEFVEQRISAFKGAINLLETVR